MSPKHLLTPLFLDQWRDSYDELAGKNWLINKTPHTAGPNVQHRIQPAYRFIARFVAETAKSRRYFPVSWTPDCTAAIPVLAGLQQAGIDPICIWLDAHGDFNTWGTTESGFLGGMPLAMITGRGEQTLIKAVGGQTIPDENVYLTDARKLDSEECNLLTASKVNHLPKIGLLHTIRLPNRPIWVHFDTDILRAEDNPASNFPTNGGPSIEEVESVFSMIKETGNLVGLSISLWQNDKPGKEKSRETVMDLVERLY